MDDNSVSDLKEIIKQFMERLINANRKNTTPEATQMNIDYFYEAAYELGRKMNLSQEYKNLFSPQDKETLIQILPNAFLTIVDYTHSLVCNYDDDQLTIVKEWLSRLYFLRNEIFNYYKELVDNAELIDKLKESIKDLDDEIERLEDDVNNWSNKPHNKDTFHNIPDLNGVPDTHYWWTNENRLYSKNKFQ